MDIFDLPQQEFEKAIDVFLNSYNENELLEELLQCGLQVQKEDDEILNFINRRFKIDCNWTNGNCLWFAIILSKRFPQSQIYYLPIEGHFVIKYKDTFYDFTGIVVPKEKPILFNEIKQTDELWYSHLIRDCFM